MADDEDGVADAGSRKQAKKRGKQGRRRKPKGKPGSGGRPTGVAAYPRHSVRKALRIPKAVLEQNAGKGCTDREAAKFAGLAFHGPSRVEFSSSLKYGFLERPRAGQLVISDLAKRILRPQNPTDELDGLREAVLNAPTLTDVYTHYRGENVPDEQFFRNALARRGGSDHYRRYAEEDQQRRQDRAR